MSMNAQRLRQQFESVSQMLKDGRNLRTTLDPTSEEYTLIDSALFAMGDVHTNLAIELREIDLAEMN